jgi:hypothetical protein
MNNLEQLRRGELLGATRLILPGNLTEFPREIFDLADTLEYLDLSDNALTTLPDDFDKLHRLQTLFCARNRFAELPSVLGKCHNLSMIGFRSNKMSVVPGAALPLKLRWLILTGNSITSLPAEIGSCTELQKAILSGNLISTLPIEMASCSKLELLRIAANRFEALPEWLLQMPKLSWLGFSGNPLCDAFEARALRQFSIPTSAEFYTDIKTDIDEKDQHGETTVNGISWSNLQLKQKLGEGASGVIYQCSYHSSIPLENGGDSSADVAVKVFKGAMTSDGLPSSEIAAYLSAGLHPYLINLLGKVTNHPEGTDALVMQLVDPSFRNLAGPPSMQSCTRDVYDARIRFSVEDALRIALCIAGAVRHLHSRGLAHGDLYAHNILFGEKGQAFLGDFGAASFYDVHNLMFAECMQKLEVRAFSCLLEELFERIDIAPENIPKQRAILESIEVLRGRCVLPQVGRRPLLEDIEKEIVELLTALARM